MIQLFPYQVESVGAVRELATRGHREIILQAETAAGKTVMAAEFLRLCHLKGNPALFLAHRRELVDQCSLRLTEHGVPHGVIMADRPAAPAPIQVASKPTLMARARRYGPRWLPPADLVVPDECHLSMARQWRGLLNHYRGRGALILGLTATPATGSGRGLGSFYGAMHCAIPPSELIRLGRIAPCKVFAPVVPNLNGVPLQGYDYSRPHLLKIMDCPKPVGDVVKTWKQHGENRQTIAFAVDVPHARHLAACFRDKGVSAAHLDKDTPNPERQAVLADLWSGDVRVVCNFGILPEGVDVPPVGCVVLAYATMSFVRFRQCCGRAKRKWDAEIAAALGKPFCYPPGWKKDYTIIIDHGGNVFRHGLPDMDVKWELTEGASVSDAVRKALDARKAKLHVCPKCAHVFETEESPPVCPECRCVLERPSERDPKFREGTLDYIDQGTFARVTSPTEREAFWHRCLGTMAHKGRTMGAAAAMYRARMGCFPEEWLPNRCGRGEWQRKVIELHPQYLGPPRPRKRV